MKRINTVFAILMLGLGLAIGSLLVPHVASALPGISTRTDPSPQWELYTASDTVNFANGLSRQIYVGTSGNVAVVNADGTAVVWPSVPSGAQLSIVAKRINATSTTASGFVILY